MEDNRTESTLVILKNDCLERNLLSKILEEITKPESDRFTTDSKYEIVEMRMIMPTLNQIQQHYIDHAKADFYEDLCQRMTDKKILVLIVKGPHVIASFRKRIGKTDCTEPNTIRGDYGTGMKGNIHASDSTASAEREIALWNSVLLA